jgi:uncharacterized protein YrrD
MTGKQVAIGADVRTRDGKSIGKVEHLIVDSKTQELSGVVADKGIFDSGRVVSIDCVESMSEKAVTLTLSEAEAKELPGFVEHEFIRLGDSAGMNAGFGTTVNLGSSGGTWMHYGPGAGGLPSTGATSYYAQGVVGDVSARIVSPLTESEIALDHGTDVVDAAGHKIGVVDDILFGDDGKIEGFIVQQGHVFHHDVKVPMEWVAGIAHDHVRLSVLKDQVAQSKK